MIYDKLTPLEYLEFVGGLWQIEPKVAETRANELIESGKIQPVLWRTMNFDGVAEAHQSMYKNEHQGKIAVLVGAES